MEYELAGIDDFIRTNTLTSPYLHLIIKYLRVVSGADSGDLVVSYTP